MAEPLPPPLLVVAVAVAFMRRNRFVLTVVVGAALRRMLTCAFARDALSEALPTAAAPSPLLAPRGSCSLPFSFRSSLVPRVAAPLLLTSAPDDAELPVVAAAAAAAEAGGNAVPPAFTGAEVTVLLRMYVRRLACRWKSRRGASSTMTAFPPDPVTAALTAASLAVPRFGVLPCEAMAASRTMVKLPLKVWELVSAPIAAGVDAVRNNGTLLGECFTTRLWVVTARFVVAASAGTVAAAAAAPRERQPLLAVFDDAVIFSTSSSGSSKSANCADNFW